jgi:predicted acylesterase/phospholipase RssA
VLSGGGYNGIDMIGMLLQLESGNFILKENIKSVYGVSAGSMALAIWLLGIESDVLKNYIIKRPWKKIFNLNSDSFFELIDEKGLLDNKLFVEIFTPLLKYKKLGIKTTLKEFYEFTKVDFYIFGTKLNNWESIKLSHHTHPDITLIDAVSISSSLPLIFKPMYYVDDYLIDGGLSKRYPVKTAFEDGCKINEILGINIRRKEAVEVKKDCSFSQYYIGMLHNIINKVSNDYIKLTYEINHFCGGMFSNIEDVLNKEETRQKMIEYGEKSALIFLNSLKEDSSEGSIEEFT